MMMIEITMDAPIIAMGISASLLYNNFNCVQTLIPNIIDMKMSRDVPMPILVSVSVHLL